MDFELQIQELKESLKNSHERMLNSWDSIVRKQLANLYFMTGNIIEGIYNLTESHCIQLREMFLRENTENSLLYDYVNCISFDSNYAKAEENGMLNRLKEMPNEWTIVQLTRPFNRQELHQLCTRKPNSSIPLGKFHIIRFPCGSTINNECPVIVDVKWPVNEIDLLNLFWNVKERLVNSKKKSIDEMKNIWENVSNDIQEYCKKINEKCLKQWIILFLGTICNVKLSTAIKKQIDEVLNRSEISINGRQKYMSYLIAEGSMELSKEYIKIALIQIYPKNHFIRNELYRKILMIKLSTPSLNSVMRNPVILILEDQFDHIPWECVKALQKHPYSRMPSLHFIHALFKIHRQHIKGGMRELINSFKQCYCFINETGLKTIRQSIMTGKLMKKYPKYCTIIRKTNSGNYLLNNIFQQNNIETINENENEYDKFNEIVPQHIKIESCQIFTSCGSLELLDNGTNKEMFGDFLKLLFGGSPCTIGMLWTVRNEDSDLMLEKLLKICLDGLHDLKDQELSRAVIEVRKCAKEFFSAAGFIVRGIPTRMLTAY